jgi:Uma2 family endonuclease
MPGAGIRIPGPVGDGGRIPDLTVWSRAQPSSVWLPTTDLLLAVEIVSPGSEAIDQFVKVAEYAAAGIPRYWTVARDKAKTVSMRRLTPDGDYEVTDQRPLAWLVQTSAADLLPMPR